MIASEKTATPIQASLLKGFIKEIFTIMKWWHSKAVDYLAYLGIKSSRDKQSQERNKE